jgi:two-component system phosphate regulon sensor histidine kinase PhoR
MLALALVASLGLWVFRSGRNRRPAKIEQPPTSVAPDRSLYASGSSTSTLNGSNNPVLAAQTQPLFLAAAATLDIGMVVTNSDREVRYLSTIAEQLLQTSADLAIGRGLIALLRQHQADTMVAEVVQDGESREMVLTRISSGRTLRLHCTALRAEETIIGTLLMVRDITQISMLERSRRDLVANVSHELRTPLASLKLLVETVQSEPPPDVARRMLGQMAQEVDAVNQLVDELYELSQIESGRVSLKLEPYSIEEVITRALNRIQPQADRKQISVSADLAEDSPPVLIDVERIGQVLLNLLHNAVKYTSTNGSITLRTSVHNFDQPVDPAGPIVGHPSGLWMVVSVHDTGIGIPAQELARIFERFYKVDRSRTRNAGGTGLGLAIAKHLVEGHGGRLWVESLEGRGSTFHLSLPIA